jgi:hypothetical protein
VIRSSDRGAKKIFEETMEDGRLSLMSEDHIAILVLKIFYLIFPEAPRGAEVEVPGVFIAQDAVFDFRPLPPVGCFARDLLTEGSFCKGAETFF